MHSDLEKLVAREKIDQETGEKLDLLPPGTFCNHKSWGPGKVVDWDRLNLKIVIDFEDKPAHEMGMKFAAGSLTPLLEGSFLAMRHSQLKELQDLAASDPVACAKLALQGNDGRLYLDALEVLMKGRVIPEGKYRSWWEGTKKKLREDRQFIVPAKRTEPLELRADGFDPSEELIKDFREARDLKAKVKTIETIIKDLNVFDNPKETLAPVVDEISDAAKKGVKLQFAPAVELILSREELQNRIKGFEANPDQITIADILASDEEKIPGLFEDLSLTRLRQVLKSFQEAFGEEEWIEKMLGLIPEFNLRSISEIASYLADAGHGDAMIEYVETGLQQRSLSSDGLAWICRERKGLAETVFDPVISLSVMSSLEADQLNEEGSVRSANRLRDLVADDSDLIPDLVEGANINTIRNFASRLVTSASFDELTRKSLMARVIKLHPEILDLVSGGEKKEDPTIFVSEESLVERKAAFEKLVREEIPKNREDIKIARSYGDLRENFEYKSAKEYQRMLMKRQDDWERDLKNANPIEFANADTSMVSIGTLVELESLDGGDSLSYTVLGAWDADPDKNIIAYLSDRGAEMLEKKEGEEVHFHSSDGKTESYKIKSIKGYKS